MDLGLKGSVAVVGGATSGLGLAIAESLAAEGAQVVMVGRSAERLRAQAERIGADPFAADLTRPEDLTRLVDHAVERYRRLDILVWNTGGPPAGPAASMNGDSVRAAIEQLFVPFVDLVQAALPHLRASDAGRILAITTAAVKEPTDIALSNSVRPGITGYLKTLATELAPDSITVNNLAPGRILTGRFREVFPDGIPPRFKEEIPIGRFGRTEEFGDVACFLASPRASYVTGVTMVVDGGRARGLF